MDVKDGMELAIDASDKVINHSKDFFAYLREPYSNAETSLIKALTNKGYINEHDIEVAAANLMVRKWIRKIKNHNAIIDKVNSQFNYMLDLAAKRNEKVVLEKPDEDWLEYFFDLSSRISNESVQQIWANILLQEHIKPGEISKVMLNTLALLDSNSANAFYRLCQLTYRLTIKDEVRNIPLIIYDHDIDKNVIKQKCLKEKFNRYMDFCPNDDELELLQEIGLISLNLRDREYYIYFFEDEDITFSCKNYSKTIKGIYDENDDVYTVTTGYVFFTQVGLTLYNIIGNTVYGDLNEILDGFVETQS